MRNPHATDYLDWLIELQLVAESENTAIEVDTHHDVLSLFHKQGKSAEEALTEYKKFSARWYAIRKAEGYQI